MYPFNNNNNNMMFPFSSMFKNNQFGFNPFELQKQMMKHNQIFGGSNSFPFSMMKQIPMIEEANSFPFNMLQQNQSGSTTFPFSILKETNGFNSFPFNNSSADIFSNFFQTHDQQEGQTPIKNQQPYLSNFPHSLIRDQNGRMDFNKISNGIQSTVGIARQMGPMLKMFGGFFR